MAKQEMIALFPDVFEWTSELSDAQFGKLMRGLGAYRFHGIPFEAKNPTLRIAYSVVASQLDRYSDYCQGKREARLKGLQKKTDVNTAEQTVTHDNTSEQTTTDEESISMSMSKSRSMSMSGIRTDMPSKNKKMIPPTIEDVKNYCEEIDADVDAALFVSYNQAKGWKMGKNPMVDWKAAVRYWNEQEKMNGTIQSHEDDEPEWNFGTVL